jgi:hypothetical protein
MMATTSQILHDGPRRLVMQFTGISDGQGDESNAIKVHVADLLPVPKSVSVTKVTYDVSGGLLQLLWAADVPVPFLTLSSVNIIDYTAIGGMTNGGGDTANGDILISTLGFDAGASYSVVLEMNKKFP